MEQSNRDLDAFASHLAHEVRSPLIGVRMILLGMVMKHYANTLRPEDIEKIRKAEKDIEHVSQLTEDLLTLARLNRCEELELERIDSHAVLREALDLLADEIEECGGEVTAGKLPTVHANPTLLCHLFRNLVVNGVTHNESAVPRVHVDAVEEHNAWVFRVEDNGVGIPNHARVHVFDLFDRGEAREVQGFGVGLALAKRIVERHGGRIWLESEPGQGSTFFFTLPKGDSD